MIPFVYNSNTIREEVIEAQKLKIVEPRVVKSLVTGDYYTIGDEIAKWMYKYLGMESDSFVQSLYKSSQRIWQSYMDEKFAGDARELYNKLTFMITEDIIITASKNPVNTLITSLFEKIKDLSKFHTVMYKNNEFYLTFLVYDKKEKSTGLLIEANVPDLSIKIRDCLVVTSSNGNVEMIYPSLSELLSADITESIIRDTPFEEYLVANLDFMIDEYKDLLSTPISIQEFIDWYKRISVYLNDEYTEDDGYKLQIYKRFVDDISRRATDIDQVLMMPYLRKCLSFLDWSIGDVIRDYCKVFMIGNDYNPSINDLVKLLKYSLSDDMHYRQINGR